MVYKVDPVVRSVPPHIEIFHHLGTMFLCWHEPVPDIGDVLERENGWKYTVDKIIVGGNCPFEIHTTRQTHGT